MIYDHVEKMISSIHVTFEEDEHSTFEPKQYDVVVDVSRTAIMDDLNSEDSIVRQKFHVVGDVEKFVDENLSAIQKTIGGDVALDHWRRADPSRLNRRPAKSNFRAAQPPATKPDHRVGQFGIWDM
jgi:hypothetical protein